MDLIRIEQHKFKNKQSTSTLSNKLFSQISRALNDEDYVLITSLDLSSAFDLVNINLLIKRLRIMGFPNDIAELIKVWLSNISFYVSIAGKNLLCLEQYMAQS
jgi:hypothetical protein